MKRPTIEELLAQHPDADPSLLKDAERLTQQLKGAGFEGARYRLATPLTGRRRPEDGTMQTAERHSHRLVRRH